MPLMTAVSAPRGTTEAHRKQAGKLVTFYQSSGKSAVSTQSSRALTVRSYLNNTLPRSTTPRTLHQDRPIFSGDPKGTHRAYAERLFSSGSISATGLRQSSSSAVMSYGMKSPGPSSSRSEAVDRCLTRSSALLPLRPQQRSRATTSWSTQFRSRRLGAGIYPVLQNSDLQLEKALFRSGTCLLSDLFHRLSRSQSAAWRATGPRQENKADGDSFCRASLVESLMNNAQLAKVYHVVPERVVSANGGGRQEVNVILQQLSHIPCHRRIRNTTITTSNTAGPNGSTDEENSTAKGNLKKDGAFPADKLPVQALRGVRVQEHSLEWMEETAMKHEEAVAILAQQLQSMISAANGALNPSHLAEKPHPQESSSLQLLRTEDPEARGSQKTQREAGKRALLMKTMQCEILGPYSCTDCTKIRLSGRQQEAETALYPGLVVDPRILVAPEKLKRITAALPSQMTPHRTNLECGCSIRMHPDFLFPVIVTDHQINSRLRAKRFSLPVTDVQVASDLTDSKFHRKSWSSLEVDAGVSRGNEKLAEIISPAKNNAEDLSASPANMKITVQYNTPSPDRKNVFITS